MTLTYYPDTRVADWIARSGTPDMQLLMFGPAVFDSYARQRFIPDPTGPGQTEGDVPVPDDHRPDIEQARRTLHTLARFTTTPDDCYFGVWEGWPGLAVPSGAGLFTLPHRRYALFHGAVADIREWESRLGAGQPIAPPDLVWPADRSWFFASDVDPHWAGIGAAQAAIDALVADPAIDVVRARPTDDQPFYY